MLRADTLSRRARRGELVETVLAAVPVVPTTLPVARTFREIDARLSAAGQRVPTSDLLIASAALFRAREIITANTRHFDRVRSWACTGLSKPPSSSATSRRRSSTFFTALLAGTAPSQNGSFDRARSGRGPARRTRARSRRCRARGNSQASHAAGCETRPRSGPSAPPSVARGARGTPAPARLGPPDREERGVGPEPPSGARERVPVRTAQPDRGAEERREGRREDERPLHGTQSLRAPDGESVDLALRTRRDEEVNVTVVVLDPTSGRASATQPGWDRVRAEAPASHAEQAPAEDLAHGDRVRQPRRHRRLEGKGEERFAQHRHPGLAPLSVSPLDAL